jgi:V8-like Glu-specific endopeptidase
MKMKRPGPDRNGRVSRLLAALGIAGALLITGAEVAPTEAQVPSFGPLSPADPRAQLDASWLSTPVKPAPDARKALAASAPVEALYPLSYDLVTRTQMQLPAVQLPAVQRASRRAPADEIRPGALGLSAAGVDMTPESVLGKDQRKLVRDTTVYPWRTVCSIRMSFPGGNFRGTGTLIARKYLLTSGHNVYDPDEGGWANSIEVVPGRDGTYAPYGTAHAVKSYVLEPWVTSGHHDWDIGLVELNQEIGTATGFVGFAAYPSLRGVKGEQAGYPGDRDNASRQYRSGGKITSFSAEQMRYKMDTAGGQSGSAVCRKVRRQRIAFGVHTLGGSSENGGCRISSGKFAWLDQRTEGSR